jgi:hypothetical protein
MGDRCRWGSHEGCDEAAGFGRFGNFCQAHSELLAGYRDAAAQREALKFERGREAAANVAREKAGRERALLRQHDASTKTGCLAPDCERTTQPGRPTCKSHRVGDVPELVLQRWRKQRQALRERLAEAA